MNALMNYFKNGGVFLFDENNPLSEQTFYKMEELMSNVGGENISETYVDDEGELCLYYDCSIIDEEEALSKYKKGNYQLSM